MNRGLDLLLLAVGLPLIFPACSEDTEDCSEQTRAEDADCAGVLTADDCDDTDVLHLAGRFPLSSVS